MKGRWDGVMKGKRDAMRGNHVKTATQTSCLIGHKRPHKFGSGILQKHFSNINTSWRSTSRAAGNYTRLQTHTHTHTHAQNAKQRKGDEGVIN